MAPPQSEGLLMPTVSTPPTRKAHAKSRLPSLYARYVKNRWLSELLATLVGTAATIALCGVLKHYDKQLVRQTNIIGVNITLNTLVSILSTICRAAFLHTVCECIGQLKWSWYLNHRRSLGDLEVFDNATRSALGGFKLLWKVNVRQIASVGALLVIGGLAIDPLSQQLVHYKGTVGVDKFSKASLPIASAWTAPSQMTNIYVGTTSQLAAAQPPLAMKGAIQNGLFSQNSVVSDLEPTCSSGNCTWPSYRTLAICAQAVDVTSFLKTRPVRTTDPFSSGPKITAQEWYLSKQNFLIDNGIVLTTIGSAAPNITYPDPQDPQPVNFTYSIAFEDSHLPIADVFIIYINDTGPSGGHQATFAAVEFVLEWCVQNFTTSVTNGTSTTQRHESTRNFTKPYADQPYTFLTAEPDDGDHRTYTVDPSAHDLLANYFRDLFQGTVGTLTDVPNAYEYATNEASQALYQPFDVLAPKINGQDTVPGRGVGLSGLQSVLDNIATGMTNMIRVNDNLTSPSAPAPETVDGIANRMETFVDIQWGWIAGPIVLLAGSILFFLAVVISSSGRRSPEIWKSSALPLLKVLTAELQEEDFTGMRTLSAAKEWAHNTSVSLTRDADGAVWNLKGSKNAADDDEELLVLGRT